MKHDDLLEGRAVRPAHRVAGQARPNGSAPASRPRATPPGRAPAPPRARRRPRRARPTATARQRGEVAAAAVARRGTGPRRARRAACADPCRRSRTSPSRRRAAGFGPVVAAITSCASWSVSGPSTGLSTASASLGQAASMIAAPGSSILPSRSRSSRLDAVARQRGEQLEHLLRRARSAPARARARRERSARRRRRGGPASPPRSSRRRPTRACASAASRAPRSSSSTRWTEPYDQLSSAAAKPARRLVVPVDDQRRSPGRSPAGALRARHEPAPLVRRRCRCVGRPRSTFAGAQRQARRSRTSRCAGCRRRTS